MTCEAFLIMAANIFSCQMRQFRTALAVQDNLMTDIIGYVFEHNAAASLVCLFHQVGNVGTLHETETRRHAPEILAFAHHRHQIWPMHPRPGFGKHAQRHEPLMQRPVLL